MNLLITTSKTLFGRVPFCGINGGIIGIIVGFLFGMLQLEHPDGSFTLAELVIAILLLVLVSWAFILLVVGVWLRYGAGQIALPALVNALITGTLTVLANLIVKSTALSVPLGWLIGILVGMALCWLCSRGYLTVGGMKDVR
ncbi:MAG: hypothetical protein K8L97_11875 [Anaerolineae bacterium]|nr:hypothetical protein [Anaerolineae bacterium]